MQTKAVLLTKPESPLELSNLPLVRSVASGWHHMTVCHLTQRQAGALAKGAEENMYARGLIVFYDTFRIRSLSFKILPFSFFRAYWGWKQSCLTSTGSVVFKPQLRGKSGWKLSEKRQLFFFLVTVKFWDTLHVGDAIQSEHMYFFLCFSSFNIFLKISILTLYFIFLVFYSSCFQFNMLFSSTFFHDFLCVPLVLLLVSFQSPPKCFQYTDTRIPKFCHFDLLNFSVFFSFLFFLAQISLSEPWNGKSWPINPKSPQWSKKIPVPPFLPFLLVRSLLCSFLRWKNWGLEKPVFFMSTAGHS